MTSIRPTIFLKGIDPYQLLESYRTGGHLKLQPVREENVPEAVIPMITAKGEADSAYRVRLNNNGTYTIIANSGYLKYQHFKEHGERLRGGKCWICQREFSGIVIGTIINYAKYIVDTPEGRTPVEAFWDGEGTFCSFECALYYTTFFSSRPYPCRDPNSFDSETALRHLYSLVTGNPPETLRPVNNPFLMNDNGGSVEYSDWKNHVYVPTKAVVLFPAMQSYLRASLTNPSSRENELSSSRQRYAGSPTPNRSTK